MVSCFQKLGKESAGHAVIENVMQKASYNN